MMKRTLLTLLCTLLCASSFADEGMWLPGLIRERIGDMRSKGFRLTAEDVYSVNRASMKDAVVSVGGFCTGEIVSDRGLLLTNHHCGYPAIQRLSSVDHDYLTHGFWAPLRHRGAARRGFFVRILVRMEEVTDRLAAGGQAAEIAAAAEREGTGYRAAVEPDVLRQIQHFLFVYEQFDDVRLVGAPLVDRASSAATPTTGSGPATRATSPSSASAASPDNRPAAYSPENVPLPSAPPLRRFSPRRRGGRLHHDLRFPGNAASGCCLRNAIVMKRLLSPEPAPFGQLIRPPVTARP